MKACRTISLLALLAVCASGCVLHVSSHHFHIQVQNMDYPDFEQAELNYELGQQVIDEWAREAGFEHIQGTRWTVPAPISMQAGVNVHYLETSPIDPNYPIEVVVNYRPEPAPFVMKVGSYGEFGREPSEHLKGIQMDLMQRLKASFGEKSVKGAIW